MTLAVPKLWLQEQPMPVGTILPEAPVLPEAQQPLPGPPAPAPAQQLILQDLPTTMLPTETPPPTIVIRVPVPGNLQPEVLPLRTAAEAVQ